MGRSDYEWIPLFESMADTVEYYRSDHAALIDALGEALSLCVMQFPIVESGEEFDDICPFTFFASFARPLPDSRRKRLIECLLKTLEPGSKRCLEAASLSAPDAYPGLHCVNERSLRFFSSDPKRSPIEIDALWKLLSSALRYADSRSAETESSFTAAYDRVVALRIPGRNAVPTALSWIRPKFFLPSNCLKPRTETAPSADSRASIASGAAYVTALTEARTPNEAFSCREDGLSQIFCFALSAWDCEKEAAPRIDREKTATLLKAYKENIASIRKKTQEKWSAVSIFQEQWDIDADDFYAMLKRSLEGYSALVPNNPTFNPHKDILVFAHNEPETTRAAFRTLFDAEAPVVERVLTFESETAALFERHRGDIIRAIPRRSSHGNFFSICAYLFLKFPDTTYLFSPSRLRALDAMMLHSNGYRIADPSSIEHYHSLCDQVLTLAFEDEALIAADEAVKRATDYPDGARHILVEDLADYAATRAKQKAS